MAPPCERSPSNINARRRNAQRRAGGSPHVCNAEYQAIEVRGLLGCIADDYTGATDLGAMISRAGLRVLLVFGIPDEPVNAADCDVVCFALKSRSLPPGEAVTQSLAALAALRAAGASRFFFKYCSTFDSTDDGNIGPVAEALADELGAERVLFCPAFPENGRTVYNGHLFVHGTPLDESGMRRHPLNPMTDANLQRVLGRQTTRQVGVLPYDAVDRGPDSVSASLTRLADSGAEFIVADTLKDSHLESIATACRNDVLMTGGSAVGRPFAEQAASSRATPDGRRGELKLPGGATAVLAGSCSATTLEQVAKMKDVALSLQIDPVLLARGDQTVEQVLRWATDHLGEGAFLIYSSASVESLAASHRELGQQAASTLLEEAMGQVAAGLVDRGLRRLVVAGGETSGAVMRAIDCRTVLIGKEIAPGVPWVLTRDEPQLALALKSGNFGSETFFLDAFRS